MLSTSWENHNTIEIVSLFQEPTPYEATWFKRKRAKKSIYRYCGISRSFMFPRSLLSSSKGKTKIPWFLGDSENHNSQRNRLPR
jgi:hypothetical protein